MSHTAPAPIRTAPLALWRVASAILHTLHMLFGAPEHVAARSTLTGKQHGMMASWLRSAEALMRRLLLIEASAFPKPNTRPLLPREPRQRARKRREFFADQPQNWRVSFRCFAPGPRAPRGKTPGNAAAARLERLQQLGAQPGQPIFIYREERDDITQGPRPSRVYARRRSRRPAQRSQPIPAQDRFWVHESELEPLVVRSARPLAERYEALLRVFNDPAPYARRLAARLHATPHRMKEALRAPPEARERIESFDECGERAMEAWRPHFSSG